MSSSRHTPWLIKIPFRWVKRKEPFAFLIAESIGIPTHKASSWEQRFRLKNDEGDFVLSLLDKKKNFWLYRCDQQRLCGDFVVVDMSSNLPQKRNAFVIDLKSGADLKMGGGGASNQLINANKVVHCLVEAEVLGEESQVFLLTGDRRKILHHLCPSSFLFL